MNTVVRTIMAAVIAAIFIGCVGPIPDLTAPPERKTVIPASDITVDQQKILDAHNLVRGQLGLPNLKWSLQMTAYATEWALYLSRETNCELRNRGSIGLALHKNGLGENLYLHDALVSSDGNRRLDEITEKSVVLSWARQAENYNYVDNSCELNERCDNYTQVVWSDSAVMGCGAASCSDKKQIWVCNYDPPGNFSQQRPY